MPDLTLTPPASPPPVERRCGTCRWFKWATGPTGRRRPTQPGQCEWPVPWPAAWPSAYTYNGRCGINGNPQRPRQTAVWATSGRICQCWEAPR